MILITKRIQQPFRQILNSFMIVSVSGRLKKSRGNIKGTTTIFTIEFPFKIKYVGPVQTRCYKDNFAYCTYKIRYKKNSDTINLAPFVKRFLGGVR
jgi:hypothetical protein